MVNKITLVGHLGRDPEIRTFENGSKMVTFTLATNESYKDKNDNWQNLTEWHNVKAWRYLAEKAERELKKGNLVYIEGKMTYRKYQDKDGVERTVAEVDASTIQLLEKRESGQRNLGPMASSGDSGFSVSGGFQKGPSSAPANTPDVDDDLPF